MTRYVVKPQGKRTWGVYHGQTLVEGGFFSRHVADDAAREWNAGTR
jgi:hypothetical protein